MFRLELRLMFKTQNSGVRNVIVKINQDTPDEVKIWVKGRVQVKVKVEVEIEVKVQGLKII